jgi:hypothetical protein
MSQRLINLNKDLLALRNEGYHVDVHGTYLVMSRVPYVNQQKQIKYGKLISKLSLKVDETTIPDDHVAFFAGETPCDRDGVPLAKIIHSSAHQVLDGDLVRDHMFSSKPADTGRYTDFYQKMSTYETILSSPARFIDPTITAKAFAVIESVESESVFYYEDTASTRAEICDVSRKLAVDPVAIVGLGGTGSYVLDLVAKTPVKEIHLFDGDKFSQHNAFRSPGAASAKELDAEPSKVAYHAAEYSKLHRHIKAFEYFIDASNVEQLRGMSFVFLCMDSGPTKRLIVQKLEDFGMSFIDVGMGLQLVEGALLGLLRVTTSTPAKRNHVHEKQRIPFSNAEDGNNDYNRNIQVADLNALNATLAVIKWKKMCGFYKDFDFEHFSVYTIDGNVLNNEDKS